MHSVLLKCSVREDRASKAQINLRGHDENNVYTDPGRCVESVFGDETTARRSNMNDED